MSDFIAPPASYSYMMTASADVVRYEWLIQAAHEYIAWKRSAGITLDAQVPEQWVQPGDLQTLSNVVSWWPADAPPRYRAPSFAVLMDDLFIKDGEIWSFTQRLEWFVVRVREWVRTEGGNPENPNESREDRARRKNRERQAAYQARNRRGSDDPEHDALIQRARHEAEQLRQAKAWLKGEIAAAKGAEQAAIAAAKGARAERISAAEAAVAGQEKRMLDSKAIADAYRSSK